MEEKEAACLGVRDIVCVNESTEVTEMHGNPPRDLLSSEANHFHFPFMSLLLPFLLLFLLVAWPALGQDEDVSPRSNEEREAGSLSDPNELGMLFAWIPQGTFMMGSNDGDPDEQPVHEVTITSGFEMMITEVTQVQWEAVMGYNPSLFKGPNRPVERIYWSQVEVFLSRLNALDDGFVYRVPTEAEWEYAARGGVEGTTYWWGNEDPVDRIGFRNGARFFSYQPVSVHSYDTVAPGRTRGVAQYAANPWGLYDMHGNVWEWVADRYDESYYSRAPSNDPKGPRVGTRRMRVVRGGSVHSDAYSLRVAFRSVPDIILQHCVGIRLVRVRSE